MSFFQRFIAITFLEIMLSHFHYYEWWRNKMSQFLSIFLMQSFIYRIWIIPKNNLENKYKNYFKNEKMFSIGEKNVYIGLGKK